MAKVWFVTGSSRGLGLAVVETALKSGASVIATARNPAQLQNLVDTYGDQIYPVALDVTNNEQVLQAVKAGHDRFGRIDVVVNNAGYADVGAVEDLTVEDFKAQVDANFYGTVYVSKAVVPILRQQRSGHIFQISSVGGRLASPGLAAYQGAKHAVGGFSGILGVELAPFGVKVIVLEPGGMATDWAGSSMKVPPISEPYQSTVGSFIQFVRAASPDGFSKTVKVAEIILRLLDVEDPPAKLLVGDDAFTYGTAAGEALLASDKKWEGLSRSSV
ncbi:short-chain dehydrogenase reductase sdr [Phlyctema vagabunda]|uniref:Short-chain dehydrogenase reductase sdr n=1 Tax=Phlyctema vagabunda TaxID=108571 RepID=A0ABR4PSP5_9HELO